MYTISEEGVILVDKYWASLDEIHSHALNTVGKQVKDLVKVETLEKYYAKPNNKGWIGNSIESDQFGIANNSRKEADVPNLNLEIKVTPIRNTKHGWSAKERLSLNIFDFDDEYKRDFDNASFIEKANLIELIYYEFIKDVPSPDLFVKAATIFNLKEIPEEDMLIIKQDWEIIINKIKEGKAEELSDSLTKYLGATTKGGKSENNMTNQPFSEEEAHRRAFTLKGSYMTMLARQIMSGKYELRHLRTSDEKVIKDISELNEKTFEEIVLDRFEPFIGMSKKELSIKLNVKIPTKNDKASSRVLAKKMLNLENDMQETDEFKKAGIAVQIVTGNQANKRATEGFKINIPGEDCIKPVDLVVENWKDSILNEYLSNTQYLLVIFEKTKNGDIFRGAKFWRLSPDKLKEDVKDVWTDTKKKFSNGLNLKITPLSKNTATGRS